MGGFPNHAFSEEVIANLRRDSYRALSIALNCITVGRYGIDEYLFRFERYAVESYLLAGFHSLRYV